VDDVEAREDGGTPAFLQTIKAALAIRLKEQMGVANILAREHELQAIVMPGLRAIPGLHLLADHVEERLGIYSFYVEGLHYNLLVRLLNDRFGVQVRGGCSCAGTYGHYLLNVDPKRSRSITEKIDSGDLSDKPGWVRLSIHPTTTDAEAQALVEAVRACVLNAAAWSRDYHYCNKRNEYAHASDCHDSDAVLGWFALAEPA
jgi:selenocysteine lyase/cysteine desulfurase